MDKPIGDKGVWIYDIETLSNCFTYTAINRDTKEVVKYVIWGDRNDFYNLLVHLSNCKGQIGFNSINFDYPVIHYIIKNRDSLIKLSADQIAKKIYKEAQKTIEKEFSSVKENEVIIPQLDLFQIWHFSNRARMTSLKKLEIAMNFQNVQDMPIHHTEKVKTAEQIEEILSYNENDVLATLEFYEKTIDKIELRKGIKQKYGLSCLNYPDSKIGEYLMLKLYCHYTNQEEDKVKKLRTYRNSFKFIDCIPSYVKFYTPEFNELLNYLKNIEVKELKDSFHYNFSHFNLSLDIGTGGLHHSVPSSIHEACDNYVIYDADVMGMYPSIAVANHFYPEHLGTQFPIIYDENILKPRVHAKEKVNGVMRDKVMAEGYKLSGNSVYGKSNSEFSFLYDPLYTLKTTLTGQLSLCMLIEFFVMKIPNIEILGVNTDGVTVRFHKDYTHLYFKICDYWEKQTKLNLEYVEYSKMIIRDVNSYISISTHELFYKDGEIIRKEKEGVKYKGAFKPHSEMKKDGEWHKAFNMGIIPIAVSDYFLKNIPVEQTIKSHINIYDFCKTFNASHGWVCETLYINDLGEESEIVPQQKNNRYFISVGGKRFRKKKEDKKIEIEAGTLVTIFNKFEDKKIEDYNIDYNYYIKEANKLIFAVDGTAERLEKEAREAREKAKLQKEEYNFKKNCIDKQPTERILGIYSRPWLIEKYGEIIPKPSRVKKS